MNTREETKAKIMILIAMVIYGTIGIFRRYIPLPSGMIALIATYKAHIVFVFGDHHALACQKDEIDGGSTEDFLCFLEQKTGKTVVKVK